MALDAAWGLIAMGSAFTISLAACLALYGWCEVTFAKVDKSMDEGYSSDRLRKLRNDARREGRYVELSPEHEKWIEQLKDWGRP